MSADFDTWSYSVRQRVESYLDAKVVCQEPSLQALYEAMRYACLGGGKRVRALLAFASAELVGVSEAVTLDVAMALELLHAYSLVHDDMPCMDNDVLRRGRPTVHVAYGEAQALLVGDALQTLAFETLAQADMPAERAVAMIRCFAHASGAVGMAGGQAIDLANVGKTMDLRALEDMHRRKTGALIEAAVLLGAMPTQISPELATALTQYGRHVGLAFQVVDDVLDVVGDASVIGKSVGKDQASSKPTYVAFMGLEAARAYAYELVEQAIAAVQPWCAPTSRMTELARFVVQRVA